jgi:predicted transcriptional regulator
MITEHRPNTIVKILKTALASNGATFAKLIEKLNLTEHQDKLNTYLSVLENDRLIAYHKGDGIYRTTHKGMHFLRTYIHTLDLLSNSDEEYK